VLMRTGTDETGIRARMQQYQALADTSWQHQLTSCHVL